MASNQLPLSHSRVATAIAVAGGTRQQKNAALGSYHATAKAGPTPGNLAHRIRGAVRHGNQSVIRRVRNAHMNQARVSVSSQSKNALAPNKTKRGAGRQRVYNDIANGRQAYSARIDAGKIPPTYGVHNTRARMPYPRG